MKNNTKKQETKHETKLTSSREKLLIQLNGKDFAREFWDKRLTRYKDLIGDILSVTSGCAVVVEDLSEYGHGCLLELFETLSISHENFYLIDFLSELQIYIFTWSMTYSNALSDWQDAHLATRGLDPNGVELETLAGPETELQ